MTFEITIHQQLFTMHTSGALFWNPQNSLLIADVHLGKVTHFRKNGFAIPNQALHQNFLKLKKVVEFFNPAQIIFLGDLFHSTQNSEWNLFVDWCKNCQSELVLIVGNHDIISAHNYETLGIKVVDFLNIDKFSLTHHPTDIDGFFNFSGHIHPGIVLRGLGRSQLKLPCFYKRNKQMILPAFGAFTGLGLIIPQNDDVIYAITSEEIILIPNTKK